MRLSHLVFLALICLNTAWADFSETRKFHHPRYIGNSGPFLLDLKGDWPDDCHPGEQKPVVREYTGDAALIEFETIIEHVTCNDVVTPYRVLVDMSDVVDTVEGEFPWIEITVRFGGAELTYVLDKNCLMCDPPPPPLNIKPEAGLYNAVGLEKQGLLLARQNQRMGVYPLTYDESGSSEWLFGGGGIVEDVYFSSLYELTGGRCLGCVPGDEEPQMEVVGKITMLMDSEGMIQVKINDGLFENYQPAEFGYGEFVRTGAWEDITVTLPDLSGRWAFARINEHWPGETTPDPTSVLPLVFDIALRELVNPPLPQITPPPAPLSESVFYGVVDIDGELLAEMDCRFYDEMVCMLNAPDFSNPEASFEVRSLSIERLIMESMVPNEPGDGIGVGTGVAVRID